MILGTLALFVVSFLLTALLAPKPKLENAKAQGFDDSQAPKASADSPVPLVLGTVRLKSPNTLWYGDFEAVPIKKKIRTGLFSKKKVIVAHEYFLGLNLGLCLGPAGLRKIYIDDKVVYENPVSASSFFIEDKIEVPTNSATEVLDLRSLFDGKSIACGGIEVSASFTAQYTMLDPGMTESPQTSRLVVSFHDVDDNIIYPNVDITNNSNSGELLTLSGSLTSPPGAVYLKIRRYSIGMFPLYQNRSVSRLVLMITGDGYGVFCDSIDEPELFGGEKEGGGWTGNFCFYPGTFVQGVDSYLEETIGTGLVPAYRGMSHISFHKNYIGESPNLRSMSFEIESFTSNLSVTCNDYGPVNEFDLEPAEAISEILLSRWRGLKMPSVEIDLPSFREAASVLRAEGQGVSVVVTTPQKGKEVIAEILRQIDGVLYQDPTSRKIVLKLIRNDYDEETLPVFDESDIIEITSFTKTNWNDLYSQVRVSYSSRDSDSSQVASAQDMAIAAQMGRLRSADVSFPFCYDKNLANKLAARELSRLSVPIMRMTVHMKRSSYSLKPGDVFKLSWPSYGISEIIMRVQKHDFGSLLDNKIIIECVQDIFAVSDTVMSTPEETGWVFDKVTPMTISSYEMVETPYFLSKFLASEIKGEYENVIPFTRKPQVSSTSFTMISGTISTDLDISDPENSPYPVSFLFSSEYLFSAGFSAGYDATGFSGYSFVGEDEALSSPLLSEIREGSNGLIFANGEWMAFEGITTGSTRTLSKIRRGLFGTVPVTHPADSVGYIFSQDLLGDGELGGDVHYSDTLYFKLLDSAGGISRSQRSEALRSHAVERTSDLPLRPRDVKLDGIRALGDTFQRASYSLTWKSTNRQMTEVTFEDDATQTPDVPETYDVETFVNGVKEPALSGSGSSGFTLDFSLVTFSGVAQCRTTVRSRRTAGTLTSSKFFSEIFYYIVGEAVLLSGDAQTGTDVELLSGDAQTGTDEIYLSGE